ncbi:hypothetical protein AAHZ94_22660 [Streptomyces sp. HSW2009]|uniref:hypothetical protein n=1 Tax=Streptomyces sp. HSW2009 TaxID=3142890 RepID=UPI0032EED005
MSRSADIDFTFRSPVTAALLVRALAACGWSPEEPRGISYAVQDADGDLEWVSVPPHGVGNVLDALDAPHRQGQRTGLSLYHREAGTGGLLLLYPGRLSLSFSPTIHRRSYGAAEELTDIPWYLGQLLPPLFAVGLQGYQAQDMAD